MISAAFAEYVEKHALLTPGQAVVVGVSGGVDSVVLLHLLQSSGYRPHVAHVNYHLRGAESEADEVFVVDLCARWQLPVTVHSVDGKAEAARRGTSLQDAARSVRYAFFETLAKRETISSVAVAHQQDDQAETVLLHLLRGTGLDGLAGMAPRRAFAENLVLIRPLLFASRADILTYAKQKNLPWREDASNETGTYTRNRIRHSLLAAAREATDPAAAAHIAHTADLIRGYLETEHHAVLRALFAGVQDGFLPLDVLSPLPQAWQQRVLLEALRKWLPDVPRRSDIAEALAALIPQQAGKRWVWEHAEVVRERGGLKFIPEKSESPGETRLPVGGRVEIGGQRVALRSDLEGFRYCKEKINGERINQPLTVRPWRPGDRFVPLGMTREKKVGDFLTDAKVPVADRKNVLLVLHGDEVVWVVGWRLDDRYKVTPQTQRVLWLSVESLPDGSGAGCDE